MSLVTFNHPAARVYLSDTYGWPEDHAWRALAIARELRPSPVARPTDEGFITITNPSDGMYTIEDIHKKEG